MVVLGARAEEITARVEFDRAEPVICAEWEDGQSASLRCGARALSAGAGTVIVTLGDAPLITPAVIARFLDGAAWHARGLRRRARASRRARA